MRALDPETSLAKNLSHHPLSPVEIFSQFKTVYDDGVMNRTNVYKWIRRAKDF